MTPPLLKTVSSRGTGRAPLPWGAPTGSEAGRRTREAERRTMQFSLAPPQRPPPNLSPPTSRASRQPSPQDVLREQNSDAIPAPTWGPASTFFTCDPPSCLAWVLFPDTPAVPGPRAQGGPKGLESWGSRSPPSIGNREHTPNSTRAQHGRAGYRPLGIPGTT